MGGCWCYVDDVMRCCRHQSVVRKRCLLAHCRQCVQGRPDEMNGSNEMKPAGADEKKKNFYSNNKVMARPLLHAT